MSMVGRADHPYPSGYSEAGCPAPRGMKDLRFAPRFSQLVRKSPNHKQKNYTLSSCGPGRTRRGGSPTTSDIDAEHFEILMIHVDKF